MKEKKNIVGESAKTLSLTTAVASHFGQVFLAISDLRTRNEFEETVHFFL